MPGCRVHPGPFRAWVTLLAVLVLALTGCATTEDASREGAPQLSAAQGRALVTRLLPSGLADRSGWATDIYAAVAVVGVPPTVDNLCSIVAVTEQESGFRVDPVVPGLPAIAKKEIDRRRESAGIPRLVLEAALLLPSSNGKSYRERLEAVRTERELSDLFEDIIGRVPFGRKLLAERNPVHTAGPMQVSIAFAEAYAAAKPYPYGAIEDVRHEVFTRRGGMYFGIAHLLDYPAPYDRALYRFADFNAGRYASRNAAFQSAATEVSGLPLDLDGDLLRYEQDQPAKDAGSTERALRTLARRLDMNDAAIRRDLEQGRGAGFERTALYARLYALADAVSGKRVPRAVLPQIRLQSPKITRNLTTDWFAKRVEARHRACVARAPDAVGTVTVPPL